MRRIAAQSRIELRAFASGDSVVVEDLFAVTFAHAQDAREGRSVGQLVRQLIAGTDERDLYGFVAADPGQIVGAVFFSRLTFDPPRDAFILSPAAVHPERQGDGVGQALIAHALRALARAGVSFVATYGDPAFYSKVGFRPISAESVEPPHKLSRPEGWLGQSLTSEPLEAVSGRCACVGALDDPAYW